VRKNIRTLSSSFGKGTIGNNNDAHSLTKFDKIPRLIVWIEFDLIDCWFYLAKRQNIHQTLSIKIRYSYTSS